MVLLLATQKRKRARFPRPKVGRDDSSGIRDEVLGLIYLCHHLPPYRAS
jgi:hypothetical protein